MQNADVAQIEALKFCSITSRTAEGQFLEVTTTRIPRLTYQNVGLQRQRSLKAENAALDDRSEARFQIMETDVLVSRSPLWTSRHLTRRANQHQL